MKINTSIIFLSIILLSSLSLAETKYDQAHFGIFQEFGRIQNPLLTDEIKDFEWFDHMGGWFVQSATINERWFINIGLGGGYQFPLPLPEDPGGTKWSSLNTRWFFWGPAALEVNYRFGEPETPVANLGFGSFSVNYLPPATNLGHYLFHSQIYPNVLFSSGYNTFNRIVTFPIQGAKLNLNFNPLTVDMYIATETSVPPLYDISIGLITKYSLGEGIFDIGAGVNFKRVIPIISEITNPEDIESSYYSVNDTFYTGNDEYYRNQDSYYRNQLIVNPDPVLDSIHREEIDRIDAVFSFNGEIRAYERDPAARAAVYAAAEQNYNNLLLAGDPLANDPDTLAQLRRYRNVPLTQLEYFSTAGIILDAFFSFNLSKLMGIEESMGANSFVLFGEVAVLGLKNYDMFYTDITERMPVMAGVNLPTFKLLDLLSVQVEYLNSPHLNHLGGYGYFRAPIPWVPKQGSAYSENSYNDVTDKDNFNWSVTASKAIATGMTLNAQVGSDHLRKVDQDPFYAGAQNLMEITPKLDQWYWALQLSLGI